VGVDEVVELTKLLVGDRRLHVDQHTGAVGLRLRLREIVVGLDTGGDEVPLCKSLTGLVRLVLPGLRDTGVGACRRQQDDRDHGWQDSTRLYHGAEAIARRTPPDQQSGPGQFHGTPHHRVEHGLGEATGKGVLLAHVVRAEQLAAVGKRHLQAVSEPGSGPEAQLRSGRRVADPTQNQDHLHPGQGPQLPLEERPTGATLARCRLVGRRGALDGCRDEDVVQDHAVVSTHGLGLAGQPRPVECSEQKVTGAVTREHAACPVGSMGGRRKAHNQDSAPVITEPGYRSTPVVVVSVCGPLLVCHLLAPGNQPGTGAT